MTAYDQGFIEKCAQYGIDPQELIKVATMVYGDQPIQKRQAGESKEQAKARLKKQQLAVAKGNFKPVTPAIARRNQAVKNLT